MLIMFVNSLHNTFNSLIIISISYNPELAMTVRRLII